MAEWVGGPNFIKVRRGSKMHRKGGAHSGPHQPRQFRTISMVTSALAQAAKGRRVKGKK